MVGFPIDLRHAKSYPVTTSILVGLLVWGAGPMVGLDFSPGVQAAPGTSTAEGTELGLWYMEIADDNSPTFGQSADSSGNLHHLTKNGATTRSGPSSIFGDGYDLSGSGGGGDYLSQSSNDFAISGDISMFIAFEVDSLSQTNALVRHWALGDSSSTNALYALTVGKDGTIRYFHEYNSGTDFRMSSTASIGTGFHTITFSRDVSDSRVIVYVDGAKFIDNTWSSGQAPSGGLSGNLRIGADGWSNGVDEGIYEVRVWDRLVDQTTLDNIASTGHADSGPPTAPQNLQASVGPGVGEITLAWTAPASSGGDPVTNYRIYRSTTNGGPYTQIDEVSASQTSYTDSNRVLGTDYFYVVTAVNAEGEGPQSNEASALGTDPTSGAPSAPFPFTATQGPEGRQAILAWGLPLTNGLAVTQYKIHHGTDPLSLAVIDTVPGSQHHYVDHPTTPGLHYYRVQAANPFGDGGLSPVESVEILTTTPSPPQVLVATAGEEEIGLSWDPPASNGGFTVTEYRVYRGTNCVVKSQVATVTSGTTYTDSGLTAKQSYCYHVTAVNTIGESDDSNSETAVPFTTSTAPQDLQAEAGPSASKITLNWDAPADDGGDDVTNYRVHRGTSSGGPYTQIAETGDTLSYTDAGLPNGATRYYKVSAVNAAGESPLSNEASATTFVAPGSPQNLQADPGPDAGEITVTWDPPANNGGTAVTNYLVYRGTTSGGETFLTQLGTEQSFIDTGLPNGATRYYKVSAVNAVGEGGLSNEDSATTFTSPSAPQNLQASPGNQEATLTWNTPDNNGGTSVTNYKIYRGTTCAGKSHVDTVSSTSLSYTDAGLTNGQSYCYHVTALNAAGEGSASSDVTVTPATVSAAPQNLDALRGNQEVGLTWSAPGSDGGSSLTGYNLYRSTDGGLTFSLHDDLGLQTTYTDTGLTNDQEYCYRVTATNGVGEGEPSEVVCATPSRAPSAPVDLDASPGPGSSQITICWNSPAYAGDPSFTKYTLYRGVTTSTEVERIELPPSSSPAGCLGPGFVDDVPVGDVEYFYTVTASNAFGESPHSNEDRSEPSP